MPNAVITRPKVKGWTIQKLAELLKEKTLNLNPVFQRKSVWKNKDRSHLLDSILRGYPIPAIILFDRTDDKTERRIYDVIDGKQRLEAVFLFMGLIRGHEENRYVAKMPTVTPDGEEVNRKRAWADFDKDEKKCILECQIPVVIVSGGPDLIRDVFVRINRTGKKLSRSEILNAQKENSPFWCQVDALAQRMRKMLFSRRVVSEAMFERMEDLMLVAEIALAVYHGEVQDKKRCVDQMMSKRGADLRKFPNAIRRAKAAMEFTCRHLLPKDKRTRFSSVSDFYSLVFLVSELMKEGLVTNDPQTLRIARDILCKFSNRVDETALRHREFKKTEVPEGDKIIDYIRAVQSNSDGKPQRKHRHAILNSLLHDLFLYKDPLRRPPIELRRLLFNEGDPVCEYCNEPLTYEHMQADHVYPHSRGGRTTLDNLRKACRKCNLDKGAKILRRRS